MVIDRSDNPRSYIIRMNNGTEMRRNNHDLRLSREEIVSNEHSRNTRRASQERTVTVDPPPEPAIAVPNSTSTSIVFFQKAERHRMAFYGLATYRRLRETANMKIISIMPI